MMMSLLPLPTSLWDAGIRILDAANRKFFSLVALLVSSSLLSNNDITAAVNGGYLLGLGMGDITGPVVEINFMGYASMSQVGSGLHMRQRSRAWIIADALNDTNRIVFINSDIAMVDAGVRRTIVSTLSAKYPGLYTNDNIAIVGTHQHSGVGGYLENLLPHVTSQGYIKQTADAIVTGTVLAVERAHASLTPGSLSLGNVTILDANINRSPSAYLANPEEERNTYEYDQDKDMTLLRFNDVRGNARGFLSFFPVHGTSLYSNNTLVSGDNKGMAAYLYEAFMDPYSMPGINTKFLAGFTQSNVGDTSPNTLGPVCQSPGRPYDGQPCQFDHSTCGNRTQDCIGRGPGYLISDFESNRIIAQAQVDGAKSLMSRTLSPVTGSVKSVHTYLNMAKHTFSLRNGTMVRTCPAALGYSFAAGTTDGPGAFDFTQGDNKTIRNPFWEIVKGFVTQYPSKEQIACHAPKPILLNTGYSHDPYEWSPSTVNIQMLRVGNFVMLILPGEVTTMAGRRLRNAVREQLISSGVLGHDAYVVIAGPANNYGHYVTTIEEYAVQRYEGASTLFGPHTLEAYIDKYGSLVSFLADNATGVPSSDPAPEDQTQKAICLVPGVMQDSPPIGKSFGDVLVDVNLSYHPGDTVVAQFVGANPRNDLRLEQTFLTVDRYQDGVWSAVKSDSHPSTKYEWKRTNKILGISTVNISWTIEDGTTPGTYRLMYFGDSKSILGSLTPFVGTSANFTVA